MRLESRKLLEDIRHAVCEIQRFVGDAAFEAYAASSLIRSAVERQFEIIGEALSRLVKLDPKTAAEVGDFRRIISFRNILAHAYDAVDHRIVWGIIRNDLPRLLGQVQILLAR